MCSFYNVSRSGYYSWLHRPETSPKDTRLLKMIEECQAKHKRRYGYRRVYSNCDEVELFINGNSKGKMELKGNGVFILKDVQFDAGDAVVKAVGISSVAAVSYEDTCT